MTLLMRIVVGRLSGYTIDLVIAIIPIPRVSISAGGIRSVIRFRSPHANGVMTVLAIR
jgi:hypothetical protein